MEVPFGVEKKLIKSFLCIGKSCMNRCINLINVLNLL